MKYPVSSAVSDKASILRSNIWYLDGERWSDRSRSGQAGGAGSMDSAKTVLLFPHPETETETETEPEIQDHLANRISQLPFVVKGQQWIQECDNNANALVSTRNADQIELWLFVMSNPHCSTQHCAPTHHRSREEAEICI